MRARGQKTPAEPQRKGSPAASKLSDGAAGMIRYRIREGRVLEVDDATSARLARVRQRGTRPELLVRQALAALGYRYRLSNRDLEGSPDIANRRQGWVVFVHGCFWHRHGCKASSTPTRNREFWEAKFLRNVARDRRTAESLRARGYKVLVIWECQTKRGSETVRAVLARALSTG
jgi:DNA mismatch endonuclease, patch repair protein